MDLYKIIRSFDVDSDYKSSELILSGHINTTLLITLENNKKYILQKMNKYVFKNPVELMENITNVTEFMKKQYLDKGLSYDRYVLDFIKSKDGKYYYIDAENEYYRLYKYIDDSETYYSSNDLSITNEVGKAFGKFQMTLSSFNASILHETIPNFHNTINRFNNLKLSYKNDVCNRAIEVKDLFDEYIKLEPLAIKMTNMVNEGLLPYRVTHNDSKCNNVLIDNKTKTFLAVIDLDTVMPGLVGFDFGDSIRSGSATAKEDETDLSKVSCSIDKFKAYAKGFLSETKDVLTKNEIDTLVLGAFNMTIECGARFLTDYLDGDKYFKIDYEKHNLDRARNQLAMAKDILAKKEKLEKIIIELTK